MILGEHETRNRSPLNLAPKGRNKPAQGNALGTRRVSTTKPCKGATDEFTMPIANSSVSDMLVTVKLIKPHNT
jgi:hypothetical protein